jgi:leucine dehydrogenase
MLFRAFQDYGRFLSGLKGAYIGAEDVGCTPENMNDVHKQTRFVNCIPQG